LATRTYFSGIFITVNWQTALLRPFRSAAVTVQVRVSLPSDLAVTRQVLPSALGSMERIAPSGSPPTAHSTESEW